jgi:hypothetical protein
MNIQARKLVLIEEFLRISDESTIEKLEYLIKYEKKKQHERDLKPMSIKEFYEMIDQAILEKKNGQVTSHQDLKRKIKSWK